MSFRIVEITDARPEGVVAKVSHQNNQLTVIVPNKKKENIPVGTSFEAEIGFDRVLGWKSIEDFEDVRSRVWQEADGTHLLGRIHSVLDYGDGKTTIDVYLQNGPEFFRVDLETVENADLEANSGLELTVDQLYLYPNDE